MDWKVFTLLFGCVFTVTFSIWLGVFFGIYYPFFIEFTPATCQVKEELWTSSDYGYTLRQQAVRLFIDDQVYLAVMCESDANILDTGSSDFYGYYAYNWVPCGEIVGPWYYCQYSWQTIAPRWMCGELSDDLQQEEGERFNCWYKSDFQEIDNKVLESEWDLQFYYLDTKSRTVAMRQESPNYHKPSYLALQIVCLGMLVIPSFVMVIFIGIPGMHEWKPYLRPYQACRRLLSCCWTYYDPSLRVQDRRALFAHASKISPALKLHHRLRKECLYYITPAN